MTGAATGWATGATGATGVGAATGIGAGAGVTTGFTTGVATGAGGATGLAGATGVGAGAAGACGCAARVTAGMGSGLYSVIAPLPGAVARTTGPVPYCQGLPIGWRPGAPCAATRSTCLTTSVSARS